MTGKSPDSLIPGGPGAGDYAMSENALPNVLLIAYGCEPDASSEPGVGWNFMRQIASFANVSVVTRANNRPRIEKALLTEPEHVRERVEWIYFDIERLVRLKNRLPFGIQAYYSLWQWKVLVQGRKLAREKHFDLCHHLTYGVCWLSPVTAFIQKPFLWGPIGGGDVMPWRFRYREPARALIQETFYAVFSRALPLFSPIANLARRRAAAIIFRTRSTEKSFPATSRAKRYVVCETAMDSTVPPGIKDHAQPVRAICVGRLEYWKGTQYALRGFHRYLEQGGQGRLTILGDGPYRQRLINYCRQHNLEGIVDLPGRLPRHEVDDCLGKANVMLHPSFRDGGSWAVLEAMNSGIPVICLNRTGLADMVDQNCGILLNSGTPGRLVADIGDTLRRFEADPSLRKSLSDGARAKVDSEYRWEHRRRQLAEIYTGLLNS